MTAQTTIQTTVKYCWPLSKNVMAYVVITGRGLDISEKDLEMLRKYLELAKDALKDPMTTPEKE